MARHEKRSQTYCDVKTCIHCSCTPPAMTLRMLYSDHRKGFLISASIAPKKSVVVQTWCTLCHQQSTRKNSEMTAFQARYAIIDT